MDRVRGDGPPARSIACTQAGARPNGGRQASTRPTDDARKACAGICTETTTVTIEARLGQTALSLLMIALPTSVLAEVCDKAVGESWSPSDGPVWLLNPIGWPLAFIVGGLIVVFVFRLRWVGYAVSAILALYLLLGFYLDSLPDPAHFAEMMLREGCRSRLTDLLTDLAVACFAALYGLLGYWRGGARDRLH